VPIADEGAVLESARSLLRALGHGCADIILEDAARASAPLGPHEVPLIAAGQRIGRLVIDAPSTAAASLEPIAELVATAIVNARAGQLRWQELEDMRAQVHQLEIVRKVAERAATLDVQGTLAAVVDAFEAATTAHSTAIYLWSLDRPGTLAVAAYSFDRSLYGPDYEAQLRGRISETGKGIVGWVLEHREPVFLPDVTLDSRPIPIPGAPDVPKSMIVIPVIAYGEFLGVIRTIKFGADSFDERHFALAKSLTSQCAVAIAAAHAERERRQHDLRLQAIIASSPVAIIEYSLDGAVRLWNAAAERMYGWTAEEAMTLDVKVVPEDRGAERDMIIARLASGESITDLETVRRRKDGSLIDVSFSAAPVRNDEGKVVGATALIADITERKLAERALTHQALHDALTGLPNRVLLADRLELALRTARREGGTAALLLLDLDDFKDVNDTFGHDAGDHLLWALARRLLECVRDTDTVARLGGDEFAIVLGGADGPGALAITEDLRRALGEPFDVEGHPVELGASIGIAVYPDHGDSPTALLRRADIAMYAAKRLGGTATLYGPEHDDAVTGRRVTIAELRRAIESETLETYYQPIIALSTGRIVGAEALARWPHPSRGLVPPSEFIPLAEQTGLIRPLTALVLDRALAEAARWSCEGHDLRIAVNLSVDNLVDPALPALVAGALERFGVRPERLCLEVTEGTLMLDHARSTATLRALRQLGVRTAIDDFGSGFSSLSYLSTLPIDVIKIDRSFIARMATDSGTTSIVRAIVGLAHELGLTTVAEGVADEPTRRLLNALGCDEIQGFLFSPAIERQPFLRLVAETNISSLLV
jgi:diguanylate cyclase (GGDEF)-like protein/PAS domain S-box-containing protein